MQNTKLPKVPNNVSESFREICNILATLCKEKLNEEYFNLSVELAAKIARKRPSPLLSGHTKTWAAGIIHALGMVNFLFDKSQSPHLTSKELCAWFKLLPAVKNIKQRFVRRDRLYCTYHFSA